MSIEEIIRREVAAAMAPVLDELRQVRRALQEKDEPDTLTLRQMAERLGKSCGALHTFLTRHPTFPRRRVGGKLVFDRAAVDRWLAEHQRRTPCAA